MDMRKLLLAGVVLVVGVTAYWLIANTDYAAGTADPLASGKQAMARQDYVGAAEWFKRAAEQGKPESQYRYAMLFRNGQGVAQDNSLALQWLQRAAPQGYVDAQYELAVLLENGIGVAQPDAAGALVWFRKAAESGHTGAALHLAVMYHDGRGAAMDDGKAMAWAIKAAAAGQPEAQAFQQQLLNRILARAGQGDAGARFMLAGLYLGGRGVDADLSQAEHWFRLSAEAGNSDAEYQLARLLLSHQGRLAAVEAAGWYQKAAAGKHVKAAAELGVLYAAGIGVAQDTDKARHWLTFAATAGEPHACLNLAMLLSHTGDDRDVVKWLKLASDAGLAQAENNLAVMFVRGQGVKKSLREAFALLQKAALSDADAQYNLALMYMRGLGTIQNDEAAAAWFKKADEHGNHAAAQMLGLLYDVGRGVVSNSTEAASWYQKAMQSGSADAMYNLAVLYYQTSDADRAFTLFKQAARGGDAKARNIIATMYEHGEGVAASMAKAVQWYQQAAEQGYAPAQFNLGNLYRKGDGIAQQDSKAVGWYAKAAEQGFAPAQNSLAYMYALGRGVKTDRRQARQWLQRAAAKGLTIAGKNIVLLNERRQGFTLTTLAIEVSRRDQILYEKPFNPARLLQHLEPITENSPG